MLQSPTSVDDDVDADPLDDDVDADPLDDAPQTTATAHAATRKSAPIHDSRRPRAAIAS